MYWRSCRWNCRRSQHEHATEAAATSANATTPTMKTWAQHAHLIWFTVFVIALMAFAAIAFGSAILR